SMPAPMWLLIVLLTSRAMEVLPVGVTASVSTISFRWNTRAPNIISAFLDIRLGGGDSGRCEAGKPRRHPVRSLTGMLQCIAAAHGTADQMGPQKPERFRRKAAAYRPNQRTLDPGILKSQGERAKDLAAEIG